MRLFAHFFNALLLAVIIILPLACGGSSGGGSPDGSSGNEFQTGWSQSQVTLPGRVAITSDNAEMIVRDAFEGGDIGSDLSSIVSKGDGNQTFDQALVDFATKSITKYLAPSTKATANETWYDSCGGTCQVSASDTSSTTVSISMNMTNYHSDNDCSGLAMNGLVTILAEYQPVTIEITDMLMKFHSTRMAGSGISLTLNGSMEIESTSPDESMEMDLTMVFGTPNITYYYSNYYIISSPPSNINQSISGGYGNSTYGSVSISTQENLSFSSYEDYPYRGVIVLTGALGENGYSSLRATFDYSDNFYVECDSDGDGIYEWSSGGLYW